MMRILIDARLSMGGVKRYTEELIKLLQRSVTPHNLILFGRGLPYIQVTDKARHVVPSPLKPAAGHVKRIFEDQVLLPYAAKRAHVAVFHSPNYFVPQALRIPCVITCHDLWLLERLSSKKPGLIKYYERWAMIHGLRQAAHIITPSKTVAQRLMDLLQCPRERITPIYPPLPSFHGSPPDPQERSRLELEPRFFLSVGTLEPRKNLSRLLQAHRDAYGQCGIPLYLVGPYGWRQESLLQSISEARGVVRWLGKVSDRVLAWLYRGAVAVVQYSLDEGFDYPVAEAMGFGAPLVLSEIPVHREVASECGRYASPLETKELTLRLLEVGEWPEKYRASLASQAKARIETLRSDSGPEHYLKLYRRAIG